MSDRAPILVVEDNPVTRKMVRLALRAEGYRVVEAETGALALELFAAERPMLVLLDLVLPDVHGFDVLRKIRAHPEGAAVPVIAVTGYFPDGDQARTAAAGFDQILIKPVEPSRLVEVVESYTRLHRGGAAEHARGRRVLVVDDDPVQLKLLRVQLAGLGFDVTTAADGVEALALARRSPPDAIVSDVLMPRLDGFRLCVAVREDPLLGATPVILQSTKFTDEADRALALKVGASAYVERDPQGTEVAKALTASLAASSPPPFENVTGEGYSEYLDRIVHQLERHAAMNRGLVQRNVLLASSLSVLGAASEALTRDQALDDALNEMFFRCVDSVAVSVGIFYVTDERTGLRVHGTVGVPPAARSAADACFGHPELIDRAHERAALRAPSPDLPAEIARDLLDPLGVKAVIVAPIRFGEERLGLLLFGTEAQDSPDDDLIGFAKGVGVQLGQAISLGRAFAALEERRRLAQFAAEVGAALTASGGLQEMLRRCTEIMVERLDAAFARCWTLNEGDAVLELQASAGLYTHIDGPHGRVPVGKFKIGLIAAERAPHLTNEVVGDPRVGDQEWARREGMVAFAGYPLMVEERLVGVVAMFARRPLSARTLQALESVASSIALAIEDRQREAAVEAALARAQTADRLKTAFLANMSHEVRTPLNVIVGYNSLIADRLEELHDETLAASLEAVKNACGRLLQTIQGVLDLSRLETDTFETHPERVKLGPLVEKAVRQLRKLAEKKQLTLDCEIEVPDAEVVIDEYALAQSLHHLLDNAIKFTLRGGVRLRVHEDGTGAICVSVRDSGVGIDPQFVRRLFEPFTQEDSGHTRHFEGAGIGLALVKRLAEKCRAELSIDSSKGRGTTATIRIPRADSGAAGRPRTA